MAFGPFTLHGNRSWRIGGDHVRLEAVARDGFVDEGGDPREGNLALVVIAASPGASRCSRQVGLVPDGCRRDAASPADGGRSTTAVQRRSRKPRSRRRIDAVSIS